VSCSSPTALDDGVPAVTCASKDRPCELTLAVKVDIEKMSAVARHRQCLARSMQVGKAAKSRSTPRSVTQIGYIDMSSVFRPRLSTPGGGRTWRAAG
jgi:hypothetical protein